MRSLAALLIVLLCAQTGLAQPSLVVTPVEGDDLEGRCRNALYQSFIRSPELQVLPDWYVMQEVQKLNTPNNWEQLFSRMPEADQALFVKIQDEALIAVLVADEKPAARIIRSEILTLKRFVPEQDCARLGRTVLGIAEPETFRNPALSATLSLLIPGAGHIYQGDWAGILLGSFFLGAYVVMGVMGLSNGSDTQLTRSQWGGLIMLLSLTDITTAYFRAEQNP